MPSNDLDRTDSILPGPPGEGVGLTTDQASRWADLIADGRQLFPDLPDGPDRRLLSDAVRDRLRGRIVRTIAQAIAADIRRGHPYGDD